MSNISIQTAFCAATKLVVKPIRFQVITPVDGSRPYWHATQKLEVTLHDGNAFLVFVVSHSGVRMQFTAIARSRLDAQLGALDYLTEPPRFCCARAIGRAA